MKCEYALPRLGALLDRELPFLARTRIRYHADRCSNCSLETRELERINMLMLEGDMFPATSAFRADSPVPSVRWKRAALVGAAGIAALLLILIVGNVVKPSFAFADVERAMQNIKTATWRETRSEWVDGKKEWTTVTEHWAQLNPPAYATRDIPELRSGRVGVLFDRTLFDKNGTMRLSLRGNKYSLLRSNASPGSELETQVKKLITLRVSAPTPGEFRGTNSSDSRFLESQWRTEMTRLGERQCIRFQQTVTPRKANLSYTPAGRIAPMVRTVWADPATRLVARAEYRVTDPWTHGRETITILDGFRYDVAPPPDTFELTPPPGVTASVEDWRGGMFKLSEEQRARIQAVIDRSDRGWLNGDFEEFSRVWDFAYNRPVPNVEKTYRSEAWARKSWRYWVDDQRGKWRSWSSRIADAKSTRYGGYEVSRYGGHGGAFVPEGDPDLLEVKAITRAVVAGDAEVKAWDTRYYLRKVGDDYRITHWSYRWPFSPSRVSPNVRERHKPPIINKARSH